MYNRKFLPAVEKAKIDKIRFHDLRHTFASLLIDRGENIKYIKNQMGHASCGTIFFPLCPRVMVETSVF